MKVALWILFIFVFVWLVSVVITIANPDYVFGPLAIFLAIVGAIILIVVWEIFQR